MDRRFWDEAMRSGWGVAAAILILACSGAGAWGAVVCGPGAAQVMVIPSLHKMLGSNPHYGYRRLDEIVADFHPDLVGVEIRAEDIGRDAAYLNRTYPREMVELSRRYQDRAFGFDWLGHELEGMAVPSDWWTKRSHIKQLERAWAASAFPSGGRMKRLTDELEALSERRDAIAARATVEALANGPYDNVTADYYRVLFQLTQDTPYALLPQWYAERDSRLARNVMDAVRAHAGCRIVIVTGADHHRPITAALKTLPQGMELTPVP